jgi:hypothetical protein
MMKRLLRWRSLARLPRLLRLSLHLLPDPRVPATAKAARSGRWHSSSRPWICPTGSRWWGRDRRRRA